MRTIKQILIEYSTWLKEKTGIEDIAYNNLVDRFGEDEARMFLMKKLLTKCYDNKDGLFYFTKFIIGPLSELGLPKPFKFNKFFRELSQVIRNNKKICIEAARGHGKCVPAGTMVTMIDGSHKPIEEIKLGDKVLSYNCDKNRIEPDIVVMKQYGGIKITYEFETKSGFSVKSSSEHKFLTTKGWKPMRELNLGDKVYVDTGSNKNGKKTKSLKKEPIVSIEVVGNEPMFDIQVLSNNNFFADKIVVHNSMFFSQLYIIFMLSLFKFKRALLISSNQPQATRILGDIKTIIETNEFLNMKRSKERWSSESIGFNKGYIVATGIGSEILGEHVDYIVLDDILRSDNKMSDVQIKDYIFLNLLPMLLNRKGTMVIVGTPKSPTDIFATIQKLNAEDIDEGEKPVWFFKKYPAILDYDKKILLCPDRFTWDQIMKQKREMGTLEFSREYMLEFFSRDKSLFQSDIVAIATEKGKDMIYSNTKSKLDNNSMYFISVDVARSGAAGADYTVIIVWLFNTKTNMRYLIHMIRKKGLKISKQCEIISELSNRFDNCQVIVERNNAGQDMIDMLIDDYNVNVIEFTTTASSKEEIIRFLVQTFEKEKIVIPQGDEATRKMFAPLLKELKTFCVTYTPAGNERYRGVGGKDDCVMSLAIGNKGTQLIGKPFALDTFDNDGGTLNKHETSLFNKIVSGLIK